MVGNFNIESEKPQFIYQRHPLVRRAFQIFMLWDGKAEYEPVGEYTVLDDQEDMSLSEKKVMNIVSLLNGRKNLMELGGLTKTRALFSLVPKGSDEDKTKIVFRNHDGSGPSKENAVLILEKGVINGSQFEVQ